MTPWDPGVGQAKLKADEQKLLNKQLRLKMEKERLKQQDAERQATTLKAMLVGRATGLAALVVHPPG